MSDNDAYSTSRREEPASGGYRDRSASPRRGGDRDDGGRRSPVSGGRQRSASPGRRMDVDSGRGRGPPGGGGGDNPGNNLHVSSLAIAIDERALESHFAKYGSIDKVQIMFDPHSQESRGFAFVTMKSSEEADAAIAGLNGTDLGGKTMRVEKARRGRARTPTPGRYFGPPKPEERRAPPSRSGGGYERPYDPRPYDSRYAESYPSSSSSSSYTRPSSYSRHHHHHSDDDDYHHRSSSSSSYHGRYDDYADDSRGGGRYDDRRGGDDRYGAAPPPRRRDYEERPYSQSGSRDYPPRDSYSSRAPRRDDTYAAPAAGYDDRRSGGESRRY